jgi:hypothetical protein
MPMLAQHRSSKRNRLGRRIHVGPPGQIKIAIVSAFASRAGHRQSV